MSPELYRRAINALQLNGSNFAADVLLMLYAKDFPNEPQPIRSAPVQVLRQRKKDSHNPFPAHQAE